MRSPLRVLFTVAALGCFALAAPAQAQTYATQLAKIKAEFNQSFPAAGNAGFSGILLALCESPGVKNPADCMLRVISDSSMFVDHMEQLFASGQTLSELHADDTILKPILVEARETTLLYLRGNIALQQANHPATAPKAASVTAPNKVRATKVASVPRR